MVSPTPDVVTSATSHLARQGFFQNPQLRTVSRCATWVRAQIDGKTTKTLSDSVRAALYQMPHAPDHLLPDGPLTCETCLDQLVTEMLRRSLVLRVTRIDDLPDAAEHLRGCDTPHVLTASHLADLLDLVPGGCELLERHGAPAIRDFLSRNAGFGPDQVGDPQLRHLLDEGCNLDALDGANRLVQDPEAFLGSFLYPALAEALPAEERAAVAQLRSSVGANSTYVGALIMPIRNQLVLALREYRTRHLLEIRTSLPWLDQVLLCLDPNRTMHGIPDADKDLRDLVFDVLTERSELLSNKYSPEVNAERLSELLGAVPAAVDVTHYPRLARLVSGSLSRKLGPRNTDPTTVRTGEDRSAPSPVPETVADVLALLAGQVELHGSLPQRRALDVNVVDAIEAVMGRTYSDIVLAANLELHWPLPAASANERRMDELVQETLGTLDGFSVTRQWRDQDLFGSRRLSVDLHAAFDDGLAGIQVAELLFEADGEGHFVPCRNFDLARQRINDAEKAACVRKARRAGRDVTLVALHHAALRRLSAPLLEELVFAARSQGAWYVFVRPTTTDDDRALPSGVRTRQLKLPNLAASDLEVRIAVS